MIANDLSAAQRLALGVVLGQGAVTLLCTGIAWLIGDGHAALSAALGGGVSTVASLTMALVGFGRRSARSPALAMRAILIGEIAKIAVVILLFAAVLKMLNVVPLATFGSYLATFVVFPVAFAGSCRDSAARANAQGSSSSMPMNER